MSDTFELRTAPVDARFCNTNQAQHCWTRFLEFHKCSQTPGKSEEDCVRFKRWYTSICPNEWVENWNEQLENGTFPSSVGDKYRTESH